MKKIYICLSLCLVFSLFAMGLSLAAGMPSEPPQGLPPGGGTPGATTAVSATEGDWTFKIVTAGDSVTSTITAYAGKNKHTVIVPSVLGGAKVTAIAAQAFGHHNEIAAVYVPDTVEKVEEWAFYDLNTATIISFANPQVEIKDGAFMSSGNAVLYLPAGTAQKSAGGKDVVTNSTEVVSVALKNEKKAAVAGGVYLNIGAAAKENQITAADIIAVASGAFAQETNPENGAAVLAFSGDDYKVAEQKVVIADQFQNIVSSDSLNKTFRVLTKEDAAQLNQVIASSSAYSEVKNLFNFTEGYYLNGNKVTLDKDIVAYDISTGEELYGPNHTANPLPNANPNLHYQYVAYQDKDNDGDLDVLYYSPYRLAYNYGAVNIASDNANLNGLSARTSLNPNYLAFANAIVKAKGSSDDQVYQQLEANTAKSGDKIGAGINQERSVLWADDYGTIKVDHLQALSTSTGNWAKMSYESGLSAYNTELVMEWGMNAVLYATNGGIVTAGSLNGERSSIYANGDGANGVLAGGAGSKAGTNDVKSDTAKVYVYNTDFNLEGWNNHVADVVYGGYAYLENVKAATGKPGSYAVGQGSALANDFGNGVVDAKNFHTTVYGNRSAGIYVIGGGVVTARDSSFISKMDAGLVVASGGTLRMDDSRATGQIAFRNRGGITPESTSVFNNVSFIAAKDVTGYVTGEKAAQAVKAWKSASGGTALSNYMMSDPAMTIGRLCQNYGISQDKVKTLLAALGKTAGKAYTEKTLLRNSILDNTFYNYSAGQYSGDTDFTPIPYLTVGSSFGGLTSSVFEFEAAGVKLELNNSTFKNNNAADYNYLVASEAGSAPILQFTQSNAAGIIWNEGDITRAVEGRSADRSSSLTVHFTDSAFTGSFADGSNGLWEVAGLDYTDAAGDKSGLNGNYYQAKANWKISASFDKESVWNVTHDSYLGTLTLENGAKVQAPEGSSLRMTVDGRETNLEPGTYKGQIIIQVIKNS
ncbi:hypothetical protein [Sporomusa sp. KB1]|uniref:hypothetical protein n=1 Tax=Sporomusa sp. KB1 TaxID=943346 RepID=UPI00119F9932|nr:hypothetical protein [Sporomusa sp. KB1]TWH45135.1 hypothetical protein Salpa_1031 [Sporomusa sp. KB1]